MKRSPDKPKNGDPTRLAKSSSKTPVKGGGNSRLSGPGTLGNIGIGLAALAVGMMLWGGIDWAFNKAHEGMGVETDLTALLPQGNTVAWISAPYTRSTRDESDPYWEPNVFHETVTIGPPYDGVMVLGISLSGVCRMS